MISVHAWVFAVVAATLNAEGRVILGSIFLALSMIVAVWDKLAASGSDKGGVDEISH